MPTKILIIDDDSATRDFISKILKDAGYDIATGGALGEGLVLFDRQRPDLVIVDYMLGAFKGTDVVKEMQRRRSGTKCMLISGAEFDEQLNAGCEHVLFKPFKADELLLTVKEALTS